MYLVDGANGTLGVKLSSLPDACHCPATAGRNVGTTEVDASRAENAIITLVSPLTPVDLAEGNTATTRSGAPDAPAGAASDRMSPARWLAPVLARSDSPATPAATPTPSITATVSPTRAAPRGRRRPGSPCRRICAAVSGGCAPSRPGTAVPSFCPRVSSPPPDCCSPSTPSPPSTHGPPRCHRADRIAVTTLCHAHVPEPPPRAPTARVNPYPPPAGQRGNLAALRGWRPEQRGLVAVAMATARAPCCCARRVPCRGRR